MLLELEAAYGMADTPGSLMDHALVGLISAIRKFKCSQVQVRELIVGHR